MKYINFLSLSRKSGISPVYTILLGLTSKASISKKKPAILKFFKIRTTEHKKARLDKASGVMSLDR